MGLRRDVGIDLERYSRLSGRNISGQKIHHLSEIGMVIESDGRLAATQQGRLVLNAVIEGLMD